MRTTFEKYNTIIDKNTFYYHDDDFETNYESHIFSVKETILHLKNQVLSKGCTKEIFEELLVNKKGLGLRALLAITGFSNESLKRLITVVRIVNDKNLNKFTYKERWDKTKSAADVSEWGTKKIERLVEKNTFFRKCIVNIFYEGSSVDYFKQILPSFEFQKLSIEKLNFDTNALIDTLARYKEKGSRSAFGKNNPEIIIEQSLRQLNIPFEKGDLKELIDFDSDRKRTMDFIIPEKRNPKFIIESSYQMTTSSGQGDKSKTEIAISQMLKTHYPKAKFIGFIDGIGWYVRKGDLKRMVTAYEDVFTFHKVELKRFEELLIETFKK